MNQHRGTESTPYRPLLAGPVDRDRVFHVCVQEVRHRDLRKLRRFFALFRPQRGRQVREMARLVRGVGTLSLVFILFFCTSGGPHTTETLIHSLGPGLGLLILLIVPLIWSLPEVLIVGELASMLPEEGGYYRWVDRAFGRFWAFQNGWITWVYSLVDMAIYPVLFIQYLRYFAPNLDPRLEWLISLAVIWGATLINLRGSIRVGR